jgi:hypothetical protein
MSFITGRARSMAGGSGLHDDHQMLKNSRKSGFAR